ncbi:MAG: hypothetical protein KDD82_31550 [Planctomycetes bacterium]|nr:hypothetical protein [Planctomycetota bacterium]
MKSFTPWALFGLLLAAPALAQSEQEQDLLLEYVAQERELRARQAHALAPRPGVYDPLRAKISASFERVEGHYLREASALLLQDHAIADRHALREPLRAAREAARSQGEALQATPEGPDQERLQAAFTRARVALSRLEAEDARAKLSQTLRWRDSPNRRTNASLRNAYMSYIRRARDHDQALGELRPDLAELYSARDELLRKALFRFASSADLRSLVELERERDRRLATQAAPPRRNDQVPGPARDEIAGEDRPAERARAGLIQALDPSAPLGAAKAPRVQADGPDASRPPSEPELGLSAPEDEALSVAQPTVAELQQRYFALDGLRASRPPSLAADHGLERDLGETRHQLDQALARRRELELRALQSRRPMEIQQLVETLQTREIALDTQLRAIAQDTQLGARAAKDVLPSTLVLQSDLEDTEVLLEQARAERTRLELRALGSGRRRTLKGALGFMQRRKVKLEAALERFEREGRRSPWNLVLDLRQTEELLAEGHQALARVAR